MRLSFGCDRAGRPLLDELIGHARSLGHICQDVGVLEGDANDYPLFAERAAKLVQAKNCDFGILVCGTGIGVSLAANKMKGIRCAVCSECYSARMTRAHNDANMLAIGARTVGPELAKAVLSAFLETPFDGGRHQARVDMIARLEAGEALE